MQPLTSLRRTVASLLSCCVLVQIPVSFADDMATLATGGYALGVRTKEMMVKVDTDGDGMVSKAEWTAFHERVFGMLDKSKKGSVDAKQFVTGSDDIAAFATGGFARGLQTMDMMHKIDANGDGRVSHDEYIAHQLKIFDMMDTSSAHKGLLGPGEVLATGGPGRR